MPLQWILFLISSNSVLSVTEWKDYADGRIEAYRFPSKQCLTMEVRNLSSLFCQNFGSTTKKGLRKKVEEIVQTSLLQASSRWSAWRKNSIDLVGRTLSLSFIGSFAKK